jgi:F0F1-type ATP synthase alpha subunit
MNLIHAVRTPGYIVDVCDSIVSVSGLDGAYSGEVIHFQRENGEITGWV